MTQLLSLKASRRKRRKRGMKRRTKRAPKRRDVHDPCALHSHLIFSVSEISSQRGAKAGTLNNSRGRNLPQSKQQMSRAGQGKGWAISILKGHRHAMPSHPPSLKQTSSPFIWHANGLFKVSMYSYGHEVIGPCLHIKHRFVLTSRRNSALDVQGWNSMLDGIRNTVHPTKKTSSMQTDTTAATSWCTNYSQALLKLFTLT